MTKLGIKIISGRLNMQAVKKSEELPVENKYNKRLKDILLNRNIQSFNLSPAQSGTAQALDSRIEAEYRLEKIFRNMI